MATLYKASIIIKTALKGTSDFFETWPPPSHQFTMDSCHKSVPMELFNFLAWCAGASDNPNFVPSSVLKSVACSCKTSKCSVKLCSCYMSNLPCIDLCKCSNCSNRYCDKDVLDDFDDSDDDEL